MKTDKELIKIPHIELEWNDWVFWNELKGDIEEPEPAIKSLQTLISNAKRERIRVPSKPGVYEAKYRDSEDRLTIGKASNLRMRVRQGLVKGKVPHSAGERIRAQEDTSMIVIRWAITDRPAAVEEELHKRHLAKFGKLPKYVKHT